MATTYWLTFRLRDSGGWERTYHQRLADLDAEVKAAAGSDWWAEPTSFYIFSSEEGISAIVARVKRAIDEEADLVVIGMTAVKGGRIVGAVDDKDIYRLFPDATKA